MNSAVIGPGTEIKGWYSNDEAIVALALATRSAENLYRMLKSDGVFGISGTLF